MSTDELLEKNPTLRGIAWVPESGHPFDELRLNLSTASNLKYDDGTLRLSACVDSAAIDGNGDLKRGVAVVGFTVCDPPLDEVGSAIAQAQKLLALLEAGRPKVVDLAEVYRAAPQETLSRIGGRRWADAARLSPSTHMAPRDDARSMYHLKTLDQAREYLQSKKVNGVAQRGMDGRIDGGYVLVGVYATDSVIAEVGISGMGAFGGSGLTNEQANAIRYRVGMNVRLRPQ